MKTRFPIFLLSIFFFFRIISSAAEPMILKNRHGMEMIRIEPGEIEIILSTGKILSGKLVKPVYVCTSELTQKQWKKLQTFVPVTLTNPEENIGKGEDFPLYFISHNDIDDLLKTLNKHDSPHHYRLPTQAEWMYFFLLHYQKLKAFPSEKEGEKIGVCPKNSGWLLPKVKQKQASYPGLFDLIGGVDEWILPSPDSAFESLEEAPVIGTNSLNWPANCTAPTITYHSVKERSPHIGLRLIREINE